MSNQSLTITYQQHESVTFPNSASMKKYLHTESSAWQDFLDQVVSHSQLAKIQIHHGNINIHALSNCFEVLKSHLDNQSQFNQSTQSYRAEAILPPPSTSIEGQLILGLMDMSRVQDAICAYLNFIANNIGINLDYNRDLTSMSNRGSILIAAAYASHAVPLGRASSRMLGGVRRTADAAAEGLKAEIIKAQEINEHHYKKLEEVRENLVSRIRRVQNILLRRERHRRLRFSAWKAVVDEEVSSRFKDADRKVRAVQVFNKNLQKDRDSEFQRLVDLFHTQLRLKAPVALWERRSGDHNDKARCALRAFFGLVTVAVIVGGLAPFLFGDYIAESFVTEVCSTADSGTCTRELSAKGPLTVAGILLIMSLMLWGIRLQYRVFLSERHLALDASEKQAFAETYLAIKEGANVNSGSEAIVLASLFRPTQDGIIRDDETGFDISAAAILAKQLGKPGN